MNYPGSKNGSGIAQIIINQIPPHDLYIEGFAGSGTILRAIRPARSSVAIDVYTGSTNYLRTAAPGATIITGDVLEHLPAVVAESGCAEDRIFIYLDPPYLKTDIDGTRIRASQRDIYAHEFCTIEQHQQLLTLIKSLKCMIMISGYRSKLYTHELSTWRTLSYNAMTRAGRTAQEWLWMNYPEPIALHDYSFLGDNRTDRQRIKRKIQRWRNRLANMPTLEKRVIMLAIQQADSSSSM